MNYCDRISNQTVIDYSQGRYDRQLSYRHSSPDLRPAKKPAGGKESTKSWVVRSFYPNKSRIANINPTPVVAASPKPSPAVTTKPTADNSSKRSPREVISSDNPKPAVLFDRSLINFHADKFKFCLVGKFPGWRPSLAQIRQWVSTKWKLHGCWSVTLLDHRHFFIRLDNEADMLYIWTRNRWFVDGHLMKVFKWFPTFRPSSEDGEPSSAAVWISLPRLPLIFFEEELLFRIAALVGKVFAMDVSTRSLSRPNVARVCVEVDLLKELPRQVWIGSGDWGYWQHLLYEKLPSYCTGCRQQGHSTQHCRVGTSASQEDKKSARRDQSSAVERGDCYQYSVGRCSTRKQVQIGPVIRENDEKVSSPEIPSEWSGSSNSEEVEDGSFQQLVLQGNSGMKCSCSPAGEQIVPVGGPAEVGGEGIDASKKAGELQGAENVVWNPDVSLKALGFASEPESRDINGSAKAGELPAAENTAVGQKEAVHGFRQVVPRSPPRRKKQLFFWKTKEKETEKGDVIPRSGGFSPLEEYKHSSIKNMTKSFSEELGRGGFGPVYKGVLPDGRLVAVKVRIPGNSLCDFEFAAEVKMLANASHINVIRLLGFCSDGRNRALVYEFMAKGSLGQFIHSEGSPKLEPRTLLSIASGVAQGLEYLQNQCHLSIAHLDVKPDNILLDEDFCPKITDFGFSRTMAEGQTSFQASRLCGTLGYMAPEYYRYWKFSKKTDVFAYGGMLLEMVLGKRPFNRCFSDDASAECLVDWVMNRVTPRGEIPGVAGEETQRKLIMVGLSCSQLDPRNRPSFAEIIGMLEGRVEDLSVPPPNPLTPWISYSSINGGDAIAASDHGEDVAACSDSSLEGR